MKTRLLFLLSIIFLGYQSHAQIEMPAPSPTFTVSGKVGFAEVSVVYSRPSTKGRKVFGELVPYNEVWRTGANASTKITFSDDVMLEGELLNAGTYALYTIPGKKEWTIILSKNTELWGSMGYNEADDALRFSVPAQSVSSHYETFTISFSDFTTNSAYLNMKWEKSKAQFKIENEVDAKVMAQIKDQVIDNTPSEAGVYFQAAIYYFNTDRDLDDALQFVDAAIEGGSERYWVVHLKAKILAKMGKKMEAKQAAEASIALAEEAGNPDYVRLNKKLIAEL